MIAFLSLGSNIGNRLDNLEQAFNIIIEEKISIISKSKIYETSPMENLNQNYFLNQVLKVETNLDPFKLLDTIKAIEYKMGRFKSNKRYMPRIIDIDILSYDNLVIDDNRLSIPHPKIKIRKFILKPWRDIAPDYILSNSKSTIKEHLERVSHLKDEVREYN